jgi:8-oxo-dGTP pyrophosphatase MutT (NUDIX family)
MIRIQTQKYGVIYKYKDISLNKIEYLLVKGVIFNKWGFPKGKKDENENDIECASRELFEETGVYVDPNSLNECKRVKVGRHNLYIYKSYEKPNIENVNENEIVEIKWMTLDDMKNVYSECNRELRNIIDYQERYHKYIFNNF